MIVIPAIDIKGGKCVRLVKGDPDRATTYSDNPCEQAVLFEKLGAKLIHIVDLDGAFSGAPVNQSIVKNIKNTVNIPVEIGGGIRTLENAREYIESGIERIVIGTLALEKEFESFIQLYRDKIIVGIDARNGMVATKGWKESTSIDAVSFAKMLFDKGVKEIIFTDIDTDGMLQGPNIPSIKKFMNAVPGLSIIASGGVSSLKDITDLKETGVKGCIVGKAIYDGRISLAEALAI